jgi:hypothetical protein|tara:strand:- start:895 stop:1689 length:795 start_codon:yes stop_codon:yes gene_type:complete
MDFTTKKYKYFCESIVKAGYTAITVEELIQRSGSISLNEKLVILRHDVDRKIKNALKLAKIENNFGLRASYYFRIPYSYDVQLISNIFSLNHEIGLHYETLDKAKGDLNTAKNIMTKELDLLRQISPVNTVSMHGNPLTKFDNRDFWKNFKFSEFKLVGEVYLSINFEKVLYYSDTGRTWEDGKYNLKDFIPKNQKRVKDKPVLKTTTDVINFINTENKNLYLLIHPERWSYNLKQYLIALAKDLLINSIKSVIILKNKIGTNA